MTLENNILKECTSFSNRKSSFVFGTPQPPRILQWKRDLGKSCQYLDASIIVRIWGSDKKLLIPPFVTVHFHVRTPLMEQWKESFVIVNIGKEGGTVLYFSCSYDWLFLSPFFHRVKKLLWFKGFLFTQDMILRSPQALCIYALFGESLSKSHFMVMAYDCVNGKLWNRSLWLFPMNTWISYRAKQGERSPLLDFFHMTFF